MDKFLHSLAEHWFFEALIGIISAAYIFLRKKIFFFLLKRFLKAGWILIPDNVLSHRRGLFYFDLPGHGLSWTYDEGADLEFLENKKIGLRLRSSNNLKKSDRKCIIIDFYDFSFFDRITISFYIILYKILPSSLINKSGEIKLKLSKKSEQNNLNYKFYLNFHL